MLLSLRSLSPSLSSSLSPSRAYRRALGSAPRSDLLRISQRILVNDGSAVSRYRSLSFLSSDRSPLQILVRDPAEPNEGRRDWLRSRREPTRQLHRGTDGSRVLGSLSLRPLLPVRLRPFISLSSPFSKLDANSPSCFPAIAATALSPHSLPSSPTSICSRPKVTASRRE